MYRTHSLKLLHNLFYRSYPRTFIVPVQSVSRRQFCYHATVELDEPEFHAQADRFLQSIEEQLEILDDFVDELDVVNSQGVLSLNMGSKGSYVINKQGPNRQIWWSSPISGPRRYYFDPKQGWLNTRDNSSLIELLQTELRQICASDDIVLTDDTLDDE